MNYEPGKIEKKWQQIWEKKLKFEAKDFSKKKKFYALVEFPYPSGQGLHIGHAFTNTILDVLARKKRAEGFNVLHPMGWDSFGLPTENSAIKYGIHPAELTARNTKRFREQNNRLAISYDWSREIDTTHPEYYKWTQWIFLQLFKHGLAYKHSTPVGWCPSCKIVLANEEIVGGNCERCGHEAEYRQQKQWLLSITKYADRLADELDLVDYPDYVKAAQRSWIGRTSGVTIDYPLENSDKLISCYSTRPDTNFGATFVVIAPEHKMVLELTTKENLETVRKYIDQARQKSELERAELDKEKTGVFTGSYCLNRLTNKKMPIWVADFVVATAGTGIVVGVPAHDKRDWQFAKKYNLEIIPVIKPKQGNWDFSNEPFVDIDEALVFNSDFLDNMPALEAKEEIIDYLVEKGWGKRAVNYHLRDWIFSRQHYWGEPFPLVYCQSCAAKGMTWWDTIEGKKFKPLFEIKNKAEMAGWMPLSEKDLPLKLPEVEKYQPTNTGESPLANVKTWVKTKCPYCGAEAERETDTMPNWAGSSWYYLRYIDPDNKKSLADKKKLNYWLPVDIYLGGAEHTTLHLLYSRFWHKFLNDIGIAPGKEPYAARRQHGIILGEDGRKMSKSLGNIINPDEIIKEFGADTLRIYLIFMGPYDNTMPWSTANVIGVRRFLERFYNFVLNQAQKKNKASEKQAEILVNCLIKEVGEDIEGLKYNTAIAKMMKFLNEAEAKETGIEDLKKLLLILAPFAPHITEELWENLGGKFSIHEQLWPEYNPQLIKKQRVTLIAQINGKVRDKIEVEAGISEQEAKDLVLTSPNIQKFLQGREIKKTIFVPDKLINFVI